MGIIINACTDAIRFGSRVALYFLTFLKRICIVVGCIPRNPSSSSLHHFQGRRGSEVWQIHSFTVVERLACVRRGWRTGERSLVGGVMPKSSGLKFPFKAKCSDLAEIDRFEPSVSSLPD